ncbi:MAG: hypothetical protein R2730_07620 [Chitinophagales bacterium]
MDHKNHLDQLSEIRSMMERSSRFISLSGLSGVVAGAAALAGVFAAYKYFGMLKSFYLRADRIYDSSGALANKFLAFLFVDAILVASVAIGFGVFFTTRRAKKKGQPIWGPTTLRMMTSLALPLITGGAFCAILLLKGNLALILPCTLIFYGLGLVNASKYTLTDIHYLGLTEILIGLIAAVYTAYGLQFWALGFGVMHIVYGTIMYFKYERNDG